MPTSEKSHRVILATIARQAMLERGLLPDFSSEVIDQLDRIHAPAAIENSSSRDLRHLLWSSIDNDDSLDLDQLAVAEPMDENSTKILVAVADVDALVKIGTAIDNHAYHNTTSVYTASIIFPMLPERLSTDLTSLNYDQDRLAIVIEMMIAADGSLLDSSIYQALVRNKAKLAYNSVAAWLDGRERMPDAIACVTGLAENLRLQDEIAKSLKSYRHIHGALSLETIEAKPRFDGELILGLEVEEKNRAKELIEDFMIAANGVVARYLESRQYPSIRRVVRTPKRWERIVEIANEHGFHLRETPDSVQLEEFLTKEKTADPLRFTDLSLAIIKLLGAGEYVLDLPGNISPGHFGLAVKDYTHSTAPNRRFSDLITHRLLKAALEDNPVPYGNSELERLAKHCTEEEDAVNKVERQVEKSAAALVLESRIGEAFEAIVTGASPKGTWVRLLKLPVEGKLTQGFGNLDVGHRLRVQLIFVDAAKGYIDFARVG